MFLICWIFVILLFFFFGFCLLLVFMCLNFFFYFFASIYCLLYSTVLCALCYFDIWVKWCFVLNKSQLIFCYEMHTDHRSNVNRCHDFIIFASIAIFQCLNFQKSLRKILFRRSNNFKIRSNNSINIVEYVYI